MFKGKKGMILLATVAVFMFVLAGCTVENAKENATADLLDQVKDRGKIVVGTEGTYKPFSYHDEKSGTLTGFDVEVAQEIGKRLGVDVEFKEIPWDGMLTSLQTKQIDMVANQVGIKPERQEKFDFSVPYTISYSQIVVHKDNTNIKSIADVKGKKAGQTPTSNYGQKAKDAGATIVAYEDFSSAVRDVAAGRVDLTINDRLAIAELQKETKLPIKTVDDRSEQAESAFPVPKGTPKLIEAINKALDEMKKDGTLAKISDKYFGEDVTK